MMSKKFLILLNIAAITTMVRAEDQEWSVKDAFPAIVTILAGDNDGTGFIFAKDKESLYIMTAHHVLTGAKTVELRLQGRETPIEGAIRLLHSDQESDIAILKIPRNDYDGPVLKLSLSENADPQKNPTTMIGINFIGEPKTQTCKTLTRLRVQLPGKKPRTMWKVSPAAPKGYSGGPLIQKNNCVIGLCSGRAGQSGYYVVVDNLVQAAKMAKLDKLIQ